METRSAKRCKVAQEASASPCLTLKDAAEALPKDVILHELLPHFNPFRLHELREVLSLREVFVHTDEGSGRRRLITDDDLKECYFEKVSQQFVLAGWREMSIDELKKKVKEAHPHNLDRGHTYKDTLDTKEAIVRAYWELTYVPVSVYVTAVCGAHVLRLVEAGDVGEDPEVVKKYLAWACDAGLDASVLRELAGKCGEGDPRNTPPSTTAAWCAASSGHIDVVDLLASEFGARIDVECLTEVAISDTGRWGHAMIDHLVERYGVDPNEEDDYGMTSFHRAAACGRIRTVQHLVEKHNVDIHAACEARRNTALHYAAEGGHNEMIDHLLERYGLDPNAPQLAFGEHTALHLAASEGHVRTVQHLVEKYHVDIHARTQDGDTALDLAWGSSAIECASYLRSLYSDDDSDDGSSR